MDTKLPPLSPSSPPAKPERQPEDIQFQVMPQLGKKIQEQELENENNNTEEMRVADNDAGDRQGLNIFKNKFTYLIGGVLLLVVIALGIYYTFFRKSEAPQPPQQTSRLPKVWLNQYFGVETCLEQTACGDEVDFDNDGLTNFQEFLQGTNPKVNDTDNDGLADGDELNIYKTDPILKYTDRRAVAAENGYTDGVSVKSNYDPLTPGLQFSETRLQQISNDTAQHGLHEPTKTTMEVQSSSNSNIDTSSWKTYTNAQYGFEFKYPSSWKAFTSTIDIFSAFFGPTATTTSGVGSVFYDFDVPTGANLLDMIRKDQMENPDFKGTILSQKTKTIENQNVVETIIQSQNGQTFVKSITWLNKNKAYDIIIKYDSASQDEILGIFDQITSSFKFNN